MEIFLLEHIIQLRKKQKEAVLVTLVDIKGSTPRKPGAQMLVLKDNTIKGTIGGGKVEYEIIKKSYEVLKSRKPQLITYKLTSELGMCCGGQMTFFMEPVLKYPHLIIFGSGHVGAKVIDYMNDMKFNITAVDDLTQNLNNKRFPFVEKIIHSYDISDLEDISYGKNTYIVIATREHALDQNLLEFCLKKEFSYLGVIGSMRKAKMQKERLLAKNFSKKLVEKIKCPIGIDIKANTPSEIAISICAEIILHQKNSLLS